MCTLIKITFHCLLAVKCEIHPRYTCGTWDMCSLPDRLTSSRPTVDHGEKSMIKAISRGATGEAALKYNENLVQDRQAVADCGSLGPGTRNSMGALNKGVTQRSPYGGTP